MDETVDEVASKACAFYAARLAVDGGVVERAYRNNLNWVVELGEGIEVGRG